MATFADQVPAGINRLADKLAKLEDEIEFLEINAIKPKEYKRLNELQADYKELADELTRLKGYADRHNIEY